MGQILRQQRTDGSEPSQPKGTSPFVRAISGKPTLGIDQPEASALAERQKLERLAQFSPRHAEGLHGLEAAEADARRERQLLGWCAQFSTEGERRLRTLLMEGGEVLKGRRPAEQFTKALRESRSWDPSKHPRGGYPENPGWWSPAGGDSSGGSAGSGIRNLDKTGFDTSWTVKGNSEPGGIRHDAFHPIDDGDYFAAGRRRPVKSRGKAGPKKASSNEIEFDSSNFYLPAKGRWDGPVGKSNYELEKPVLANGKEVRTVEFRTGVPNLRPHALPGSEVTVLLTGEPLIDRKNAIAAWTRLNPNVPFPADMVFHHDPLNMTDAVIKHDGQKLKAVVGKMYLVPRDLHRAVFHEGSASLARKFYDGVVNQMPILTALAADEAIHGGKKIAKAAKGIVSGAVPKKFIALLGRGNRLLAGIIPFGTTGYAILNFASNAEANGVPRALAEATPVLSDIIAVHDLASDLAKEITDEANAKHADAMKEMNAKAIDALDKATRQTIATFRELAEEIEVTNVYSGPHGLVDGHEVAEALTAYQNEMQGAYYLQAENGAAYDFKNSAAAAKENLKKRLKTAATKHSAPPAEPPPPEPVI